MRRNPDLAHKVTQLPEIADARHKAIDKVTSAHLVVDLLSRATAREIPALEELELEERVIELMEDVTYEFRQYLRVKLKRYEEELQHQSNNQCATIERGNKLISDTIGLAKERGIQ